MNTIKYNFNWIEILVMDCLNGFPIYAVIYQYHTQLVNQMLWNSLENDLLVEKSDSWNAMSITHFNDVF